MTSRSLVSLCCIFAITAMIFADDSGSRLRNINVDEVLNNDRLFNNYFKCLMDQGPCTAEASRLKQLIPKAVANRCANCTKDEKEQAKKALNFLLTKKPDQYKALTAKYDPDELWKELV
ncbi:ejaculatory bulb-specific protein 3-like [Agrilus planipennis]|uniref:Ejaculatory bulb-specific protein 3-like n=1 Tax=Agrilus planipennis TaxID=224129 RepID=A0A7F5R0H9_AGRPL|nr:ejaculatory bulb-specific protein 3-like [Agrilus planipennis]